MTNVPETQVPTMTTITAPQPTTFPSDATRTTTITTDFLALVGFAARLGTCVNNDAASESGQDAKSVRDEAMLLMSLLMGEKAEEILSEEIGVKESRCEKKKRKNDGGGSRPKDRDMGIFSFTFPSLSLQPDATPAGSTMVSGVVVADETKATGTPSEIGEMEVQEDDNKAVADQDQPPPSQLLSRTQSIHDKDGIRDSSEAMAHNVLESFGAALVWRAKTWIKSLTNVLALKEQKRIDVLKATSAAGKKGEADDQGVKDKGEGTLQLDDDKENDDLMNSKEMQIIDAIVKSSEEVSVVNIKTAFRVLPNRVSLQNSNALPIQDPQEHPTKKAKKEESESPQDDVDEYKVTHKLMFEATISMTSNDGVRYNGVKLQAPGYIQGTFVRKSKSGSKTNEGEETLTGISMTLDTDALALSLERQSRLVVRRAAEAALMAASGIDCNSSPKYMESPHVHHSIISPRYVLMSPMPAYPSGQTYNVSFRPVPTVQGESGKSHTPVVSSSEGGGCSSDSSANTTPSFSPATDTPSVPPPSPSFPALLSVANEELTRGD